jgi:tRNA uridine 5-carbamoylmethylation protein Kti12
MNDLRLILVRGLPGSGKSTIAKTIAQDGTIKHLETDMYWINLKTGEYEFDMNHLADAHEWCQNNTAMWLGMGTSIVVSNTFTTKRELYPYFTIAKVYGIVPQVILAQNQFDNVHNVPQAVLDRMKDRFEYDISELFES